MRTFVGLDRSPSAAAALQFAARLADRTDGHVVAAHAWSYGPSTVVPGAPAPSSPEAHDEEATTAARAIAAEVLDDASTVEAIAVRGPASHAIAAEVHRRRPDLVAVGRRTLGSVDPRLLGSVGRRLIEHATCPVILVGEDAAIADDPAPVVLVGLDGSEVSFDALRWALQVAPPLGGTIVAVHAAPVSTRSETEGDPVSHPVLARAAAELADAGVPHRLALAWGDPRTALEAAADEQDAALVVVATRGLGALDRLLLGSTAAYLAQHLDRSLAVIPPSGRG